MWCWGVGIFFGWCVVTDFFLCFCVLLFPVCGGALVYFLGVAAFAGGVVFFFCERGSGSFSFFFFFYLGVLIGSLSF